MQTTQNKFELFKLNRQLLNAIEEAGYTEPTPIQEQAIPLNCGIYFAVAYAH
jgi:ATP-dependent RNA helicase RhlE